jgi:small subunit ribosomal protein S6
MFRENRYMLRYETLFLARTDITDNDLSMIEKQFDKQTADAKGRLVSFDKWGKLRLAFPIKKSTHGVYVLVRYELPPLAVSSVITELDSFFKIKCSDIVLRYVTVKLSPTAPTVYARPDAIEGRTGSLDNFLKENKIDNLLSSVDASAGAADANNDSE